MSLLAVIYRCISLFFHIATSRSCFFTTTRTTRHRCRGFFDFSCCLLGTIQYEESPPPQLTVKEFEKVTRALDNFKVIVGLAVGMLDLSNIPTPSICIFHFLAFVRIQLNMKDP